MKIGRGVSELWRVENRPLPLTSPMAYTTACTTVQAVIERLVAKRLINYLTTNDMLPKVRSAYRSHHSTETAVAKILSDILLALDEGDLAYLALLDLSAAFDSLTPLIMKYCCKDFIT